MTFEDCYEDYLPWSAAYKRVWDDEGVEGIRRLKGGKVGLTDRGVALARCPLGVQLLIMLRSERCAGSDAHQLIVLYCCRLSRAMNVHLVMHDCMV
jgi:hypothetical protein